MLKNIILILGIITVVIVRRGTAARFL